MRPINMDEDELQRFIADFEELVHKYNREVDGDNNEIPMLEEDIQMSYRVFACDVKDFYTDYRIEDIKKSPTD